MIRLRSTERVSLSKHVLRSRLSYQGGIEGRGWLQIGRMLFQVIVAFAVGCPVLLSPLGRGGVFSRSLLLVEAQRWSSSHLADWGFFYKISITLRPLRIRMRSYPLPFSLVERYLPFMINGLIGSVSLI